LHSAFVFLSYKLRAQHLSSDLSIESSREPDRFVMAWTGGTPFLSVRFVLFLFWGFQNVGAAPFVRLRGACFPCRWHCQKDFGFAKVLEPPAQKDRQRGERDYRATEKATSP